MPFDGSAMISMSHVIDVRERMRGMMSNKSDEMEFDCRKLKN
ncbi:hypothetical protein [Bosea sp. TAB14]